MLAGRGDAVGVGQLLDEGDLPLGGPAVVAGAGLGRFKGDEGFVLGHRASRGTRRRLIYDIAGAVGQAFFMSASGGKRTLPSRACGLPNGTAQVRCSPAQ
jgi:hypothetical protein